MGINFTNTNQGAGTADNAVAGITGAFSCAFHFWNTAPGSASWDAGTVLNLCNGDVWTQETASIRLLYGASTKPGIQVLSYHLTTDANHYTALDLPTNQWVGVALKYDPTSPATDPIIYVNGVADTLGTSTNGVGAYETRGAVAASPDTILMSKQAGSTVGIAIAGGTNNTSLAEVGVWGALLDDAVLASLSMGYGAYHFLNNLIFYAPIWNTGYDDDIKGFRTLTWYNAPGNAVDHPRIFYPGRSPFAFVTSGGAPAPSLLTRIERHYPRGYMRGVMRGAA